uniref:Uncharacterized protein n=1 Tax=Ochrobactrum phage ORM_20 TaxID=2985243 RepID=A0A9N6ZHN3_9VIRU|nr:hypothetical protein ORM20_00097 [Ochrobactrum phage ORM_20]
MLRDVRDFNRFSGLIRHAGIHDVTIVRPYENKSIPGIKSDEYVRFISYNVDDSEDLSITINFTKRKIVILNSYYVEVAKTDFDPSLDDLLWALANDIKDEIDRESPINLLKNFVNSLN